MDQRLTIGKVATAAAFAEGKPAPLTEKLTLQPQQNAAAPDKITLDMATVMKAGLLMKEMDKKNAESLPK